LKTFASKFVYFLAAIFLLAGCAGHPPRQVAVAILGIPTTIGPNQTVTFTGVVNNDKTTDGVSWAVTGAGTFTSTTTSLTYTAPPTVPENPVVTVMATSISTPTATATGTFTIATAALSVNITNPVTTVTAGGDNVIVNATVTNDVNNQGVSWSLFTGGTTTECAPGCGTIVNSNSTSATYMPPATVPANASASLVATSLAAGSQSATDTFTIQASGGGNLGFLMGNYAMEAGGFDESGNALTMAGSFVSDGNGNIVSGEFDVNDNFGVSNVVFLNNAGTYTLESNLRGIITLNQPLPGFSETPTFAFTIDAGTNNGEIISADSGEQAVSGSLAHQSTSNGVTPSGSFIFRASSDASNIREGEVGQITIGAGGAFTGLVDQDDIGEGARSTAAPVNGTFTAVDGAGRGTFSFNGGAGGGTAYAYYAVSPTQFFILENDDDVLFMNVGVARVQNLSSLTTNSPNGVGAFGIIGGDTNGEGGTFSSVAIGQLTISGGNTASVVCDLNDAGSITACAGDTAPAVKKTAGSIKPAVVPSPVAGTVTFDPATGRGTITFPGGFDDGFIDSAVVYIESNGTGVILDTTASNAPDGDSFPEALVGDWIPQTSTADVVGQVQGLGLIAEAGQNIAIEGEATIQGSGQTSGLFDGAIVDSQPILDSSVTGTIGESDGNGRSSATLSATIFPNTSAFGIYEVSPTQFFIIGEDEVTNTDSPLGIFTPQTLPQQAAAKTPAAAGVTSTKPKAQNAVAHHGHPRPNAAKPKQLPAR
jgi:hypothetical protein